MGFNHIHKFIRQELMKLVFGCYSGAGAQYSWQPQAKIVIT